MIISPRDKVNKIKVLLAKYQKCKDLGLVTLFIGLQIQRENKTLKVHQSGYVLRLLTRFSLDRANSRRLPFNSRVRLELDTPFEEASLIRLYQQIISCLLYLLNQSRPNISQCITQLAYFISKLGELYLQAIKEVLWYIQGIYTYSLIYDYSQPSLALIGYLDASQGTIYKGKSYTSQEVLYYGAIFAWYSNVQRSTTQSSIESEIIAANELSKELAQLERLQEEVTTTKQTPILYYDNTSGIDVVHYMKHYSKSKYIDI